MPNRSRPRLVGQLWLVVAVLSLLALALGLWDMVVERDGGNDWLMQAVFPLLLGVFALTMYRRQNRSVAGGDAPPTTGRG